MHTAMKRSLLLVHHSTYYLTIVWYRSTLEALNTLLPYVMVYMLCVCGYYIIVQMSYRHMLYSVVLQ